MTKSWKGVSHRNFKTAWLNQTQNINYPGWLSVVALFLVMSLPAKADVDEVKNSLFDVLVRNAEMSNNDDSSVTSVRSRNVQDALTLAGIPTIKLICLILYQSCYDNLVWPDLIFSLQT